MSTPDSPKPISLSLRVTGGIMGITREIAINGNQAEWQIPQVRKDLSPNDPITSKLSDETVSELTQAVVSLKEQNPQEKYSRESGTVRDGQSYVLKVHEPIQMAIEAADRSGAPEAFYRLTGQITKAALPRPQTPPQS